MKKWIIRILIFYGLFFSSFWILDVFDEEVSEFNGKLANFLRGNDFALRSFTAKGIPISNFGRLGIKAISPFYVAHYGLIYSNKLTHSPKYNYLWKYNNSIEFWNIPPNSKDITEKNFYYAVDWILENMSKDVNGVYHLMYNFDWYYRYLKGGVLKAPWHSGLTDSMALSLLIRAYILTNDDKYKIAANRLYKAVILTREDGGSTIVLKDSNIWIEEYVATFLSDSNQPRVLNGMISASFSIYFYEKTFNVQNPYYLAYFESIRANIHRFDLGYWTAYDLIGTVANYKYHKIHLGLLKDLHLLTNDQYYLDLHEKWGKYSTSFIMRHFYHARPTINSLMSLLEYLAILILLEVVLIYAFRVERK